MPSSRESRLAQIERVKATALRFYEEHLLPNEDLRRKCEDREVFQTTFEAWKAVELAAGRQAVGGGGSILFQMSRSLKMIKVISGEVVTWLRDPLPETTPASNEERIQRTVKRVRDSREELEKDRNGIEVGDVTMGLNASGQQTIVRPGTSLRQMLTVKNRNGAAVLMKAVQARARKGGLVIEGCPAGGTLIKAYESHNLTLSFEAEHLGVTRAVLVLNFYAASTFTPFSITRHVMIRTGDPDAAAILRPSAPFRRVRPSRDDGDKFRDAEVAPAPPRTGQPRFENDLKQYRCPAEWRDALAVGEAEEVIRRWLVSGGAFGERPQLRLDNYTGVLQRLLWTEEAQMEVDIRSFDMNGKKLEQSGRIFRLQVPGLAENRPSVLKGDILIVAFNGRSFEGYVERIEMENVVLRFGSGFHASHTTGMPVDIRFKFKRMQLRLAHQAVDATSEAALAAGQHNLTRRVLFPESSDASAPKAPLVPYSATSQIRWLNRYLNEEQKAAVLNVMRAVARPMPYVIYGPPGTGKTVTLCEAILQTLRVNPSFKLLVAAPSNSAADLLVQRITESGVSTRELLRVIAFSRDKSNVPGDVLPYARYDNDTDGFVVPPAHELRSFRIVVVTLSTAGKLPNLGVCNHFTHVFIDEAGHAIEPEAVGAFATLTTTTSEPVVVLAGDPQQLGPIVRSEMAKKFGLDTSLLERLVKRDIYRRRDPSGGGALYDERVVTKLVRNYRSHPVILQLPNEMFYDGDLIAAADPVRSHILERWEHLQKQKFPIIFHGVEGEDSREGNSPSWYNPDEVQIVKNYVDLLVRDTRRNRCKPEDIGVVTPYQKQVQKIRMLLRANGYDSDLKVGSVDEFQGQERRVIIISTVRSSKEWIDFDVNHVLGFVANPKRFNVAVTRAQALLVVVGNPHVLADDPQWGAMLKLCLQNNAYTGCPPPEENKISAADFLHQLPLSSLGNEDAASAAERSAAGKKNQLKFYHGTGDEAARNIVAYGFQRSPGGLLGPGIYVAAQDKAEKFARHDRCRYLGAPVIIECLVRFSRAKFIAGDDEAGSWIDEGYDAIRSSSTSISPNMEWCFKDPSQVKPIRHYELGPEGPTAFVGMVRVVSPSTTAAAAAVRTTSPTSFMGSTGNAAADNQRWRTKRAWEWWEKLGEPNRDAFLYAVENSTGMKVTAADVELLPFDELGNMSGTVNSGGGVDWYPSNVSHAAAQEGQAWRSDE